MMNTREFFRGTPRHVRVRREGRTIYAAFGDGPWWVFKVCVLTDEAEQLQTNLWGLLSFIEDAPASKLDPDPDPDLNPKPNPDPNSGTN